MYTRHEEHGGQGLSLISGRISTKTRLTRRIFSFAFAFQTEFSFNEEN